MILYNSLEVGPAIRGMVSYQPDGKHSYAGTYTGATTVAGPGSAGKVGKGVSAH